MSHALRLVIDATRPPSSGIGRYSWNLLAAARQLAPRVRPVAITLTAYAPEASRLGVEVALVEGPPRSRKNLQALADLIDAIGDVYIATHFSLPVMPRAPVIQVVHDLIYPQHPEWQPTMDDLQLRHHPSYIRALTEEILPEVRALTEREPGRWRNLPPNDRNPLVGEFYKYAFSASILRAKATVAVSELVRIQVAEFYPTRPPIAVIPPTRPAFLPRRDGRRDSPTRRSVLYVANFEPRKNHSLLLEALTLPEVLARGSVDLVLVGREHFASHYEQFLQHVRVARTHMDVQIRRDLDDATLGRIYQESDVFAFPSLAEGFGIPLAEALAVGTPIVALDTPFGRDICHDAATYVSASDARMFAHALLATLNPGNASTQRHEPRADLLARLDEEVVAASLSSALMALGFTP